MIFPAEEEEEEEEDKVSFRHITSQSLREGRWTSCGSHQHRVKLVHRSELFLVYFLHLSHAALVRPRARGPPRAPRQEVAESDVTICISAVRMNAIRSKRLGSA